MAATERERIYSIYHSFCGVWPKIDFESALTCAVQLYNRIGGPRRRNNKIMSLPHSTVDQHLACGERSTRETWPTSE